MTEELNGCPFCGGEAEFIGRTPFRPSASVVCMACDAAMFVEPKEEAIAAWNTRIAGQAELAAAMRAAVHTAIEQLVQDPASRQMTMASSAYVKAHAAALGAIAALQSTAAPFKGGIA
jgi:Lar family restriction alleviation protein